MNEPDWRSCTEEDLWKYVASHLSKNGVSTVLVGGAVVSIYSDGAYRSGDIDLVLESIFTKQLPDLMREIGFVVERGRHYKHPKCKHLMVDFASPPPSIGEDTRLKPSELKFDGATIKIYSPTDCVRDRLASYIHFKAYECLDQAVMVAKRHPVDLSKIKAWSKGELGEKQYEEFLRKLKDTDAK